MPKRLKPQELLEKHADAKMSVELDGNFTIVVVRKHRVMQIGVAKRNPTDDLVLRRGQDIALYRALVKLDKSLTRLPVKTRKKKAKK